MNKEEKNKIIYSKLIKGSFWLFLERGLAGILVLIKDVILPLFIIPQDLGFYQLIISSIGLFSIIFGFNCDSFLKQKESDKIEDYLNVAWTYSVIKGIFLFILTFTISQILATIYNNQKVIIYVRFVAFSYLFQGFINLKIIFLERELDFKKFTLYNRISEPLSTILLIIFLILNLNIWALFLSYISISLFKLILSYTIYPKRLKFKFSLIKLKEIYKFEIWIYFSGLLIFAYVEGIYILIGLCYGLTALGLFLFASGLSNISTREIAALVSSITFPAYSRIQGNKEDLRFLFLNVLKIVTIIIFLIGGLIICLSREFFIILYNEKWYPVIPLIPLLCLFGINRAIANLSAALINALKKPKKNTYHLLIFTISEYILVLLFLQFDDNIIGVAWSVLIASFIIMFLSLNKVVKELKINWLSITKLLIFPTFAFVIMILVNYLVNLFFFLEPSFIKLLILMVFEIFTYFGIIILENVFFDYPLRGILNEIKKNIIPH